MSVLDFLFQGKPPPSTTTYGETVSGIPQFMSDYTQGLLSRANAVAGEPYQPYGGPRLAEFTPEQQRAFQMTGQSVGQFMPTINTGLDYTRQAAGKSSYGAAQPYMDVAGRTAPSMVGQYMSPYQDLVANRIGQLAGRNLRENLMPNINRDFIRAGQYGSSRMMDTIGGALRDTQESALAQQADLLNKGYGQAIGAAQTDLSRFANLGQLAGNLTAQDVNALLSSGAQMGTLGQQGQAMNLKDLAALEAVGQTQQGQAQKGLDIAYGDFQRQRDYPKEQLSMLNSLIRGLPYGTTTSTSSTGPASSYQASPLAQLAGSAALLSGLRFAKGGKVRNPNRRSSRGRKRK
jgi:hypothetical protein